MSAKKPVPKKKPSPAGRKPKITADALRKIEEVAALDGSVEEMAFYAGVHRATLYRYLENNEEFRDRIENLRMKPILKIRQAAVKMAEHSYGNAMDYLSRKRKKEFSLRTEITGAEGGPVVITPVNYADLADEDTDTP